MRLILIVILCSPTSMAFGQKDFRKGYVIENSTDTLRGYIDLRSNLDNSQECVFKASEEGEIIVYSPKEIQSYRLGNEKYYVSKEVTIGETHSTVFLEYLVDGISDLFYLKLPREAFYFLEGEDGSLLRLSNDTKIVTQREEGYFGDQVSYSGKSNQYRRILMSTFRDSPETIEKIQNTAFTHEGLIKITKDYHENTCDWDCTLFGRKRKNLIFVEPIVGVRFSSQGLREHKEKARDQSAILGVNFRMTPFRVHYLWTWSIGLNYTKNSFDAIYNHKLHNRFILLKANYATIGLPLSLEYTLPLKGIKPFFMTGIEPSYALNVDYLVGNITFTENQRFRKVHLGAFAGAGLRRNIGSNYAKLMVQYSIRRPVAESGFIFDRHYVSEWRFSLAFGLKIRGEGSEFEN
ncbi:MAG: hypothetical protein RIA69_04080 [Cyclobacteriaceae bacterium]